MSYRSTAIQQRSDLDDGCVCWKDRRIRYFANELQLVTKGLTAPQIQERRTFSPPGRFYSGRSPPSGIPARTFSPPVFVYLARVITTKNCVTHRDEIISLGLFAVPFEIVSSSEIIKTSVWKAISIVSGAAIFSAENTAPSPFAYPNPPTEPHFRFGHSVLIFRSWRFYQPAVGQSCSLG